LAFPKEEGEQGGGSGEGGGRGAVAGRRGGERRRGRVAEAGTFNSHYFEWIAGARRCAVASQKGSR